MAFLRLETTQIQGISMRGKHRNCIHDNRCQRIAFQAVSLDNIQDTSLKDTRHSYEGIQRDGERDKEYLLL